MSRYGVSTGFIDLLFLLVLYFIGQFMLAVLLINPPDAKNQIESKAEFIITVEWDDESKDDVDTWVQDPTGNMVWFQSKEVNYMVLERDDTGYKSDTVIDSTGSEKTLKINEETVTIRGIMEGEYVINVHLYSWTDRVPRPVKVKMVKVNPYRIIFEKEVVLKFHGQEISVMRVQIDKNGDVVKTIEEPKKLMRQKKASIPR